MWEFQSSELVGEYLEQGPYIALHEEIEIVCLKLL